MCRIGLLSLSSWRAWIEMPSHLPDGYNAIASLSSWRAWIEICPVTYDAVATAKVALLMESVD